MRSREVSTRTDVSTWPVVREEQAGAEAKLWIAAPSGRHWLFKPTRYRKTGERVDADFAEVISGGVAQLLGLPFAVTELAVCNGSEGVISEDVRLDRRDRFDVRDGADLLLDVGATGFVPSSSLDKQARRQRPGHSLENIRSALADVDPHSAAPDGLTAFDVFAGYLLLDAWIGNADRHDQNWAVLEPALDREAPRTLSPTFDHGSALGSGVLPRQREAWTQQPSMLRSFVEKGRATPFENQGRRSVPTLVVHAGAAIGMCSRTGFEHWTSTALRLPMADARTVVERVPELSEGARMFIIQVLDENARRMTDECHSNA